MSVHRRDLLVLGVVALALRAGAALLVGHPPYTDAAYYTVVAQQLASGEGFTSPVVWSFLELGGHLPTNPALPVPSNGHWMPLTAIIAAGSMAVLGTSWQAGQLPMIVLGVALVLLTYEIGWQLWQSRRVALGGAILATFAGPMLVYAPMVDGFVVFGVTGALAILAAVRAVRSSTPGPWLLASGACVGLAFLARVDGLVLGIAPAVAWVVASGWRGWASRLAWGFGSAALFGVVAAPWLIRDLLVFGSPLPSAGGHMLWITTYNDQFSISTDPSPASYFASGLPAVIGSKLQSLAELLGRTTVLLGGIFAFFFAAGLWRERRRRELLPFVAYFVAMLTTMTLIFTLHAPKGAYYHSALAWLPFAAPLAMASLAPTATAVGRVWPFLRRPGAHRFILVAGLAGAVALSFVGSAVLLVQWQRDEERLTAVADFLARAADPSDRVLSYDPPRLFLRTGLAGVAPPFDPFEVVDEVVNAYDIRWVVVQLPIGEVRDPLGLWDGAVAVDSTGASPGFLPSRPAFEAEGVRVFEVVD